jgi:B12-binding domain/radical SAM domain protein
MKVNGQAGYDLVFLHAPSVYDFRQRATLWGPISDLVPSTPVFDMYPIGFGTMMAHLENAGYKVRILNLAARMVHNEKYEPEEVVANLQSAAFGIDLHWLTHAHGALEIARLVKKYHPQAPVIFGGYSSSYFHLDLIRYPQVDYVLRGDSTEAPLERLMEHIQAGNEPVDVPNLTWKNRAGQVEINPQTYLPENLDHLILDYYPVVRSVVRDRDLLGYMPFTHWLDYPIMAALTVKGCTEACTICGGSSFAGRNISGRCRPSFRSPEKLAGDVRRIGSLTRAPVFILGDLRQAGTNYARRFFRAVQGFSGTVMVEFFRPVDKPFMEMLAEALPRFIVEFSPESHDERVRKAAGLNFSNQGIEESIAACLDAGARRFDLFYMIGLPQQTAESVLGAVDYTRRLLRRFDDGRLMPFISPLAPFLDPGSLGYEKPEKFGYIRKAFTLEDHRQRLLQPTWKHILSYETRWLDRDTLADVTYEAGLRLNRLKREHGLVTSEMAWETEVRIGQARALMVEIDQLVNRLNGVELERAVLGLKGRIDRANTSTVCDKSELDVSVGPIPFQLFNLARVGLGLTA